jgi:hypothetical protein
MYPEGMNGVVNVHANFVSSSSPRRLNFKLSTGVLQERCLGARIE